MLPKPLYAKQFATIMQVHNGNVARKKNNFIKSACRNSCRTARHYRYKEYYLTLNGTTARLVPSTRLMAFLKGALPGYFRIQYLNRLKKPNLHSRIYHQNTKRNPLRVNPFPCTLAGFQKPPRVTSRAHVTCPQKSSRWYGPVPPARNHH